MKSPGLTLCEICNEAAETSGITDLLVSTLVETITEWGG
jgi:hypothetical protein